MREIKFRAWDNILKKMFNDVDSHKAKAFVVNLNNETNWEIMQYTGLKDKNGKEIYEGDIINLDEHFCGDTKLPEHQLEIAYCEGGFNLVHLELPNKTIVFDDLYQHVINKRVEVIGNIYENPEILK